MRTFLLLLAVLAAGCQMAKDTDRIPGTATVQEVTGPAEIRRGGGTWERTQAGDALRTGDEARTANGAQMNFRLREHGGFLTLMPNSHLQFEQLGPKTPSDSVQAVLNLPAGRVTGDTLKMSAGNKIVVKTPNGISVVP